MFWETDGRRRGCRVCVGTGRERQAKIMEMTEGAEEGQTARGYMRREQLAPSVCVCVCVLGGSE